MLWHSSLTLHPYYAFIWSLFSLVFHHLTLWFLLWSAITSQTVTCSKWMTWHQPYMVDFGCFWCLFGYSGISWLLGMVGVGEFCSWLLFALISGGLHLGLNFHFIQLHVPCHNECNSTLCKKHSLSMQMTRARELFLAHKVWSVWNFVMIHVPFDLSKFGFIFMSLVAPCHHLPSYDLARKKAYIVV